MRLVDYNIKAEVEFNKIYTLVYEDFFKINSYQKIFSTLKSPQILEEGVYQVVAGTVRNYLVDDFNDNFQNSKEASAVKFLGGYSKSFTDANIREAFYNKYKLNERLPLELDRYLTEFKEIISRVKKDAVILSKEFGISGLVTKVAIGLGDYHANKSVASLEFEDGCKVIYKPQKNNQQLLLDEMLATLSSFTGRTYPSLKVKSYENYSWMEYIEENEKYDSDIFYKGGAYLGIFYLLGAYDLHYENVRARDNDLFFIDSETFSNAYYKEAGKNVVEDNVLSTGMLPYSKGYINDINFSSFFSKKKQISKLFLENRLRFTNETGFVTEKTDYELELNDFYGTKEELHKFIDGFMTTLNIVMKNKQSFKNVIKNIFDTNIFRFRKVIRNTSVYGEFLEATTNPSIVKSATANDILEILYGNSNNKKIANVEVKELAMNNIPSFYVYSNSKGLYDADGRLVIENYLAEDGAIVNNILQRIEGLSYKNIERQSNYIKLSFLATHFDDYKSRKENEDVGVTVNHFLKTIQMDKGYANYCGLIRRQKYGVNYGEIFPGLCNTGGWMLALYLLDSSKYKETILALFNSLKVARDNLHLDSEEADSFYTGWKGIELVRKIIRKRIADPILDEEIFELYVDGEEEKLIGLTYNILLKEKTKVVFNTNSAYYSGILLKLLEGRVKYFEKLSTRRECRLL